MSVDTSRRIIVLRHAKADWPEVADHYDVWILTQNRAKSRRKCKINLWVNLHLTNTFKLVLDRILNS